MKVCSPLSAGNPHFLVDLLIKKAGNSEEVDFKSYIQDLPLGTQLNILKNLDQGFITEDYIDCVQIFRNAVKRNMPMGVCWSMRNSPLFPSEILLDPQAPNFLKLFMCQENNTKIFPHNIINKCHNLRIIDLSNNLIRFLPDDLSGLVNLQRFDLNNNKLEKIPYGLLTLPKGVNIGLRGNPFTFLSKEAKDFLNEANYILIEPVPNTSKVILRQTDRKTTSNS